MDAIAASLNLSRSELIEQIGRGLLVVMPKMYQKSVERGGKGYERIGFVLPNGLDLRNSNDKVDDLVIQYYIALWLKYLRLHPDLVEYAKNFDKFENPFKGKFPFC